MSNLLQRCFITLKSGIINNRYIHSNEKIFSFKSACCLENLYPKSNLNLCTPKFVPDNSSTKFSGYIPMNEIDVTYSCSSGPGGQNVNKVNTKVDVRFNVKTASWLNEEIKEKILKKCQNNINKNGYLVIKSDLTRSQQLNLADALQKLRKMIRDVIVIPSQPSEYALEKHRKRKLKSIQERIFYKKRKSNILSYRQGLSE